jgi:hypothetical protein
MHDPSGITQRHIRSRKHIIRDRLPEHLDAEDVGDYFLGLALDVWVHEGDVVVAADYVAER